MANERSLANKYRPKTLDQVVGAPEVVAQLKAIFKKKSAPNTIIFYGPSGVGKTTLARLVARYLNCKTWSACGKCESCLLMDKGVEVHPDVKEINAAGERGIDEMRNLVSGARFSPNFNVRVIIIDECFHRDTNVQTTQGLKRIADIKVGDMVFTSLNVSEPPRKVLNTFSNVIPLDRLVLVSLTNGTLILCSNTHKFFTHNCGWIEAKSLAPIHKLETTSSVLSEVTVLPKELLSEILAARVTIYEPSSPDPIFRDYISDQEKAQGFVVLHDIEVAEDHKFFANGVLVHNCHALTPQAQQLMLKPLEEPPPNTVFILGTTNPEKLPTAMLGRNLRMPLNFVPVEDMMKHLHHVAKQEGRNFLRTGLSKTSDEKEIEEAKVSGWKFYRTLADLSAGQMRDALFLLESMLLLADDAKKVDLNSLFTKFMQTYDVAADRVAVKVLYNLYRGRGIKAVGALYDYETAPRQLLAKMRWANDKVLRTALKRPIPYADISYKELSALLKANKVIPSLTLMLAVHEQLNTAERNMNSSAIPEFLLLQDAIYNVAARSKQLNQNAED